MVQILAPSLAKALWLSGGQSEGGPFNGCISLTCSLTHSRQDRKYSQARMESAVPGPQSTARGQRPRILGRKHNERKK